MDLFVLMVFKIILRFKWVFFRWMSIIYTDFDGLNWLFYEHHQWRNLLLEDMIKTYVDHSIGHQTINHFHHNPPRFDRSWSHPTNNNTLGRPQLDSKVTMVTKWDRGKLFIYQPIKLIQLSFSFSLIQLMVKLSNTFLLTLVRYLSSN